MIPGITVWGVNCLNDLLAALNHPELETEKVYQPRIRAEDLLREGTGQDTGDFGKWRDRRMLNGVPRLLRRDSTIC